MTQKNLNAVPITPADLREHLDEAKNLLSSVSWLVTPELDLSSATAFSRSVEPKEEVVSIRDLVSAVDQQDDLLTDVRLHSLRAIRGAFQIARHVALNYSVRAGVPEKGGRTGLTQLQLTEVNEKKQTAAAIALFVMARYMLWDMRSVSEDNPYIESVNVQVSEVDLSRIVPALKCAAFYLGRAIQKEVHGEDARLVAVVYRYAELLQDAVLQRVDALKHTTFFSELVYQLEATEFAIAGFELQDLGSGAASVEFNRVSMDSIVGNKDAKHFARRLVERLLCYDLAAQRNPFLELGGDAPVFLGKGIPGTGKSMLIAAIATLLQDRCGQLGIPFLFHPLPDTVVSTFQGGSAEHMVRWMKPLQDPTRIIFAPIDDAENNLEERTRQGVSAGVREVIGVFLRYTEGAYAVNRGNATIGVFTNLAEQLDKAVLSRIQARFEISGARTAEDFMDQDHLWWRKIEEVLPGFVNMADPEYVYLSHQGLVHTMGEARAVLDVPNESRVRAVYEAVLREADPRSQKFYGLLYRRITEEFPFFSSRDVRNIQKMISGRLIDFDLPEKWMDDPELFFRRAYDEKLEMLRGLMRDAMGGIDFAEVRRQEVIYYLDSMASIADADFNRRVEERVSQIRVQMAAEAIMDQTPRS